MTSRERANIEENPPGGSQRLFKQSIKISSDEDKYKDGSQILFKQSIKISDEDRYKDGSPRLFKHSIRVALIVPACQPD